MTEAVQDQLKATLNDQHITLIHHVNQTEAKIIRFHINKWPTSAKLQSKFLWQYYQDGEVVADLGYEHVQGIVDEASNIVNRIIIDSMGATRR